MAGMRCFSCIMVVQAISVDAPVKVKEILSSDRQFTQEMFAKLLTRTEIPHIFLSDVNKLVNSMKKDFPDIVKINHIGYSWENRPINMITIDADGSSLPITSAAKEEDFQEKKGSFVAPLQAANSTSDESSVNSSKSPGDESSNFSSIFSSTLNLTQALGNNRLNMTNDDINQITSMAFKTPATEPEATPDVLSTIQKNLVSKDASINVVSDG